MGFIQTLRSLRGASTCPECGGERECVTKRHPRTLLVVEAWECGACETWEVIDDDAGGEADFTRESEWRPLR